MELKNNIIILKISYISQILLLIIIIILSVYYKYNIEWMSQISLIFFYILFNCLILMIIPPIIFFIILFFKKSYNILFKLLKITIILFIIRIVITIEFLVIFIITYNNNVLFYKYCPFNFKQSDLTKIFPNLIDNNININIEEIKNNCMNKRCFEFNNIIESINYSYICNYNLEKSFNEEDEIKYRKININDLKDNNTSEILLSYINICNPYIDIFICNLIKNPKRYSIDINYKCPEEKSSIFEIILTLLNIVFPISIFVFQFIHYKKILKIIVTQDIQKMNKTKDSSNKSNKSNKSFKKDGTELIIVDNNIENKNEEYLIEILQKSKENTKKKKSVRIYKKNLCKDNDKGNLFIENLKTINPKHNRKNSFIENQKEFNSKDNISDSNNNDFEIKSNRLLTEINENNKEKQEEEKAKYITIKK